MKSRSIVFLILVIVLTAFIFSNSMQDAQTSSGQSGLFVALLEQFMGIFGAAVPQDAAVTIVRKGAHVAEFFERFMDWCAALVELCAFYIFVHLFPPFKALCKTKNASPARKCRTCV